MPEFNYKIEEEIGVLSEKTTGWRRELNLISWNDREAKYDIRDWAPEHSKMAKGISLSLEEVKILKEILNQMDI